MSTLQESPSHGQRVLRRFESYGFWIGLGLGLLVGVLASGPNFHDWTVGTSIGAIAACATAGAAIGYFAGPIGVASEARGPGLGGGPGSVSSAGPLFSDGGGSGGGDAGGGGSD